MMNAFFERLFRTGYVPWREETLPWLVARIVLLVLAVGLLAYGVYHLV